MQLKKKKSFTAYIICLIHIRYIYKIFYVYLKMLAMFPSTDFYVNLGYCMKKGTGRKCQDARKF